MLEFQQNEPQNQQKIVTLMNNKVSCYFQNVYKYLFTFASM